MSEELGTKEEALQFARYWKKEAEQLCAALANMIEVARLAQEAAATAETRAVTRCVEIADGYSSCEGIAEKVADAIKKEYGL